MILKLVLMIVILMIGISGALMVIKGIQTHSLIGILVGIGWFSNGCLNAYWYLIYPRRKKRGEDAKLTMIND